MNLFLSKNKLSAPSIFSAIQKLRFLLTKEEKIRWIWIFVISLITAFLELTTALAITVFAQILTNPDIYRKYLLSVGFSNNISPGRSVFYAAIIVGIVYLIKNIVSIMEVFFQNFSIQRMNYHFKNKLLHRYAKSDYEFYLNRNSALGIELVKSDTEQIFSFGMIALANILSEGLVFLCLISTIIYLKPALAFTIFAIGIILGCVITKILLPKFYNFGQKLQTAQIGTTQNLQQFFHGFKEIILSGKRDAFINAYKVYSKKKTDVQALQTSVNSLPRMIIEILFVGLFITSIALMCSEHESPIQMIGILGAYLYTGFRLMPGLNRIINQLNVFKSSIPNIERVYNECNVMDLKENYKNIPEFEFQSTITIKDIKFRYANTKKDALGQVSFKINKGDCIGIVGETGSGKSTLIDVILGLLKPYEGYVLVDEKFSVNSYQWHEKIGYVPQSLYLIDDTIEANIAFGEKKIDQKKLIEVIHSAQLSNFIKELPIGIKTIVGECGIRLSGGEKQRIAIARALYHQPEILIFDEATSALDNATETSLIKTIHTISQNRTVIMIAHRLTTLKYCDKIIVMESGTVKTITTYENLDKGVTNYVKH